jgi:hypothetical protein
LSRNSFTYLFSRSKSSSPFGGERILSKPNSCVGEVGELGSWARPLLPARSQRERRGSMALQRARSKRGHRGGELRSLSVPAREAPRRPLFERPLFQRLRGPSGRGARENCVDGSSMDSVGTILPPLPPTTLPFEATCRVPSGAANPGPMRLFFSSSFK